MTSQSHMGATSMMATFPLVEIKGFHRVFQVCVGCETQNLSPLGVADRISPLVPAEFCFRLASPAKTKFGRHEWPDSVCQTKRGQILYISP